MTTLTRDQIIEAVSKVRNGTIARVTYQTELPLKAEYKKQGYSIIKVVETSGRFGVNYHNIGSVIARKAAETHKDVVVRKNNYTWVIKHKVKHNESTGKDYIVMANFNKGHHTKSKYIVIYHSEELNTYNNTQFENSYFVEMVINSYWNKSNSGGEVKTITFENIIRINDVGTKVLFD